METASRSLYFGNVHPSVTYYDVCKLANGYGPLELVKIVPEKKCAFVNFVKPDDARQLHEASQQGAIELFGQKAIIGWAKSTPIRPEIQEAIDQGATRNLFVAGIGGASEHVLSALFLQFGDIENIVCMPRKGFGFVNMTSVKKAIEAKTMCDEQGIDLGGRRLVVKYAKEGVNARDPRTVMQQPVYNPTMYSPRQQYGQPSPHGGQPSPHGGSPHGGQQMRPYQPRPGSMTGPGMPGSRALYLGNLAEEVTNSDLCKLGNKFGALELVRLNQDKKNGFINFVDAACAEEMFMSAQERPIVLFNTPVRIGWAKSAPLRPEIQEAISQGATRNLYIGGISDNITEDNLKELIAPYCHGEFDGVHILRQKKIGFVNLISVKAAIQAKQALQAGGQPIMLDEQPIKINFAKETIGGQGGQGVGPPSQPRANPRAHGQQQQQQQHQQPPIGYNQQPRGQFFDFEPQHHGQQQHIQPQHQQQHHQQQQQQAWGGQQQDGQALLNHPGSSEEIGNGGAGNFKYF